MKRPLPRGDEAAAGEYSSLLMDTAESDGQTGELVSRSPWSSRCGGASLGSSVLALSFAGAPLTPLSRFVSCCNETGDARREVRKPCALAFSARQI